MTKSKRLPKKEYTETKRFLKLKVEYLENDDKYIQSKRDKAKKWLTEESADKLLKEVREKEEKK